MQEWETRPLCAGAFSFGDGELCGSVFGLAVDDGHDDGGEDDPGELVPVKEGEAEERGRGAGVERGEEQAGVGQEEGEEPGGEFALRPCGYGRGLHACAG